MKYIITIFFMAQITCFAQIQVNGLVQYGHKQSLGLGAPVGIDYNAVLKFNRYQSAYICKKDSLEGGHVNKFVQSRNKDVISVSQKITNKIGFIYHFDKEKNIAKSRDIGFMYVKEEIPKINWELTNETKEIGNFSCRKAVGHFRGREYTAWYTRDIPVPYGPWKLQGLPGLILEAYDTNKEVYFYFKSIEYPYNTSSIHKITFIEIPDPSVENKQWITFADFKRKTVESFKRGVENFRMISEQKNITVLEDKKPLMKNAYLEVFKD